MKLKIRKAGRWWIVEELDGHRLARTVYGLGDMMSFGVAVALADEIIRHRKSAARTMVAEWRHRGVFLYDERRSW